MGIKATHFWRDATNEFSSIVEKELGMAVKIDIINNFK
jgi:exopolyphosphatase/pppGpp-phosphohydrolase